MRAFWQICLVWIAVWLSVATASFAQEADYADFDRIADIVETAVENNTLPDQSFQNLRGQLVEFRETFLDAQDVNGVQVDALEAQLNALGPAPADGQTEDATISARREELGNALREVRAPQIKAIEAYARADALIGQIDTTLRGRQADALLELQRTPLDPSLWPGAFASMGQVLGTAQSEIATNLAAISAPSVLWQRVAIAALLLALAFFLVFRGPRLTERLLSRIESRTSEHSPVVYGFLLSFGGVLAAVAGVSLINAALISTGILGETGRALAIGVNLAIVAYAVGRWLGGRSFPARASIPSALILNEADRQTGRRLSAILGVLAGVLSFQGYLGQAVDFAAGHLGVLMLPVTIIAGIVLFRLGRIIWRGGAPVDDEATKFGPYVMRLTGRATQLVGIATPILAAIGLFNLAHGILLPFILSLALIAFLLAVHFVIRAGYAMVRRLDAEAARQALAPVLASLGLTLVSLPFFALIWGARNSDLGEAWSQFRTGFKLGETTISPGALLTFGVVFALGFGLTRLVQGTLRSSVLPRTRIDKGGQNAIVSGLGYLGVTIAALIGVTAAGIDLSSFAIVIGALGVGIGFGLQNIVNNFVSGIILLIERPIGEGDWVEVNGQMGIVKSISVRSTRIETFDRTDVIVPNGDLISGTVTNWTRGNSIGRIIVPVGVAYGTDTKKVEAILKEIAENNPLVAVNPAPSVVFQGFGADSMDFEIRAILTDINFGLSVRSDMNHEIARRFVEEGIEIPYAQRDIWLRNPEVLRTSDTPS